MGGIRGALHAALTRSQRRHFEGGGTAESRGYAPPPPPPTGPEGGPTTPGALAAGISVPAPAATVAALDGARARIAAKNAANIIKSAGGDIPAAADPDNIPTPPTPPDASPQAGSSDMPAALPAGYQPPTITDPSQRAGAINLPLLAAAGAFLKPTKSGSFSEALGNAFEAAVPVAEKDRQQTLDSERYGGSLAVKSQRNAELKAIADQTLKYRALGMDQKAAEARAVQDQRAGRLDAQVEHWRQQYEVGMLNANTRSNVGVARIARLEAQTALDQAKQANPHATAANVIDTATKAMMQKINPDTGENYTYDEAYQHTKNYTATNAQRAERLDFDRSKHDLAVQKFQEGVAWHAAKEKMTRDGFTESMMKRVLADAANMSSRGIINEADAIKIAIRNAGLVRESPIAGGAAATPGATPTAGAGARAWPTPSPDLVAKLKAAPGTAALFEEYYGPGSAAKALAAP